MNNVDNTLRGAIRIVVVVVLFAAIGGGWYFYGPCGVARVNGANDEMDTLLDRLDEMLLVANSTDRGSLSGPISELQKLRQEVEGLQVPGCLQAAHAEVVAGLDAAIDGFVSVAGGADSADVISLWVSAFDHIAAGNSMRQAVSECAPRCSDDELTAGTGG